jgi:predicted RNase H-like HicB family nuclease
MNIRVIIYPAQEGGYWAEVPALPGCITEGDNMEELINNLKDAIMGWLEVVNDNHKLDSTS